MAKRLQKELEEANSRVKSKENGKEDPKTAKKKPPMLGEVGKGSSGEVSIHYILVLHNLFTLLSFQRCSQYNLRKPIILHYSTT